MATKETHIRERRMHIVKRDAVPFWQSVGIRALAIAFALIVCSLVVMALTRYDPVKVFSSMFKGAFGTSRKVWYTFQNLAMLLCVSLAVTPAFKMKFWNLGAEGQTLIGGLVSAAIMINCSDNLPSYILVPLIAVAATLGGMLWGLIPAFFKAKFGTNETLFTLMMNYVAMQLISFCIVFWENPKDSNTVGTIGAPWGDFWFPSLFGQKYLLNIIIVAILTVAMYIYLKYSKHGYEIAVVGESENTARYVGINVKKVIIRTMMVSGAICGIAGFLLVTGTHRTINTDIAGGMGFTAVMVSWLAKFNPIVMALTSFLIVFLERGAGEIATACRLDQSISDILTGIILFFIIGCEFFVRYKVQFNKKHKEG